MTKPIPRDSHLKICVIEDCTQDTVICKRILQDGKPCNQKGHPELYKSGEYHIVAVVRHTHFLPLSMQDQGRNDFHSNRRIKAPESIKTWTWKISKQRKYPDEVRENLGWNESS